MKPTAELGDTPSRFERLSAFLAHDPANLQLLGDAAGAAMDEGDTAGASTMLQRYAALSQLTPQLRNLEGLIAIAERHFEKAVETFSALMSDGHDDPAIRFNLAWCNAILSDHEAALALLDDYVVAAAPRAGALKVQVLHHLGLLDEALECGRSLLNDESEDPALLSALAVAALDAEQKDLARDFALRAGDSHEGLSTLGMLSLDENRLDDSVILFERALDLNRDSARARLGRGLAALVQGDAAQGVVDIDRAAALFGDHLGTWVASGWAHYVKGDLAASRVSFEKALSIDDNFAETHGGLAVLDVAEGFLDSARRRTEIALRLDPRCLSAALAKSMILDAAGDTATAERVRKIALNAPIGTDGRTIAKSMIAMGRLGRQAPRAS